MTSRTVDIRIERVYDSPDKADGTRVLVDRLWPRGLLKEKAAVTLWLKEIAPSTELREWFGHDPARWAEFGHRYRAELARNDGAVAQLANLPKLGPMTLLYAAHDTEHDHAFVLSAYLSDHLKHGHGHHRPVCDLLGCTYPIVLAGMGGVARSELVAAVTKAGGFGFLGMVREPAMLIRSEVEALRARNVQRFGVNLIPVATDRALLDAQVLACMELGVPVMGLFWDVPLPLAQRLRDAEIIVVCQVGSLAEARAAEHAGAQVLIVQGLEAGGHVRGDAPLDKLLPAIAEQTGVPVLAAGGLADGADLAKVMSLGAQGGVFGTVLIAIPESFAHDYHKQRLVDADGEETVLTDAFHINWPRVAKARVLANSVTRGERGDPFSEARTIIGDELGRPIYQFNTDSPLRAMTGTLEAMALYAGTGVGRITDIVGAADRVLAIAAEAARLLDANATPPSERADLASPACLAHEMDDRYMRFASREDLLPALNELLEAERAGARVTLRTAAELSDELKPFVMAIHRDDARWCGGAHPSGPAIGRRALVEDWSVPRQGDGDGGHPGPARLSQSRPRLGRAQAQGAASDHPHEAVHTDLAAMLASHESNIELVTAQLPMTPHIGTPHER